MPFKVLSRAMAKNLWQQRRQKYYPLTNIEHFGFRGRMEILKLDMVKVRHYPRAWCNGEMGKPFRSVLENNAVLCEVVRDQDFGSHSLKIDFLKILKPIKISCVYNLTGFFFRGVNCVIWPQFEESEPKNPGSQTTLVLSIIKFHILSKQQKVRKNASKGLGQRKYALFLQAWFR